MGSAPGAPAPYTADESERRIAERVAETQRRKAQQRDERARKDAQRNAGLEKRHSGKLARIDAAAVVDTSGGRRCRYLLDEDPPTPCPNERLPGSEWCRPHLTRAVQLARRLGLSVEGEQP